MKLEPLNDLIPASYNPRDVDAERLDLVELSLRKLGWLLPIYAAEGGEILSGHQRAHVAARIGYERVPVVRVGAMPGHIRKAVNILFNRSTNDMDFDSEPERMTKELQATDIRSLANNLPDWPTERFPCMEATDEDITPFLRANEGKWLTYALNVAKSLWRHHILMPVVVDPDGIVVNGIGRLQLQAEKKMTTGRFVRVTCEQAEFARLMLNLLSMDFAIHTRYADLLRHNSFRRARRVRKELGRGFVFSVIGNKPTHRFDINRREHRQRWVRKHGRRVLDFGAGHLHETRLLQNNGIDVTPFEPYRLGADQQIDKVESLATAHEFLEAVATGREWTSIFISSVLNSVPFEADRRHIVKICAACCTPGTRVYAVASSEKQTAMRQVTSKFLSSTNLSSCKMLLNYEPNVMLGEIQELPKIQKYHTPQMFYDLFKTAFENVRVDYDTGTNVSAVASSSKGVEGLKEALEFEFNLPYPDGSRMGLAEKAIQAFESRLGTKL